MQASKVAALTSAGGGPPPLPDPTVDTGIPGLALIPPKVVQKILRGEFVDMHKLLLCFPRGDAGDKALVEGAQDCTSKPEL